MEANIIDRLREILRTSDLNTTTGKGIRKQLEAEFSADLSAYKPVIREEIQKYLELEVVRQSQEDAGPLDSSTPAPTATTSTPKQKGGGGNEKEKGGYSSLLSPEMSAFFGGAHEMKRTQVVKKMWEYIKANNLQNPKDRRKIDLDDVLAKLFKAPLTMFNMNKQLSRHCKTDDRRPVEKAGGEKSKKKKKSTKAAAAADKRKKGKLATKKTAGKKIGKNGKVASTKKKSKVKSEGGDGSGEQKEKRKGGGGFGKVLLLEPLKSFMGIELCPRTEVVKKIWAHIKEHNCKDPNDGRQIVPDSTLGKFLTAPVNMFTMNKQLNQYYQKIPKVEAAK
jgi:upstream activation factor subunit UAF30